MADDQLLGNVLALCTVEKKDGILVIQAPNTFCKTLMQPYLEELRVKYKVAEVFISVDEGKAKKQEQAPVSLVYTPPGNFHLDDHLSPNFKDVPYRLTESNSAAYHAVQAHIQSFPSPSAKPLMIVGDIGQGKTHMAQYFAWQLYAKICRAQESKASKNIAEARNLFSIPTASEGEVLRTLEQAAVCRMRYITAEDLTQEHKKIHPALWGNDDAKADEYAREREKWYAGVRYLFLDDIHAFAHGEKKGTIEWTYRIVNRFLEHGDVLISVSDTLPGELERRVKDTNARHELERLLSRLQSGGLIRLDAPSSDELQKVLFEQLSKEGISLGAELLSAVAQGINRVHSYRGIFSVAGSIKTYAENGIHAVEAVQTAFAAYRSRPQGELFAT